LPALSLEKNFPGATPGMAAAGEVNFRWRATGQQSPHLLDDGKAEIGHAALQEPLPDGAALQGRRKRAKLRHVQFFTFR
jgi:hypothetical protein